MPVHDHPLATAVTPRIERLRRRAWAGEFGPFTDDRARLAQEVLATPAKDSMRVLQIAQILQATCETMPPDVAADELIVGRRTVYGYPEVEEAIARGSAEPGYMIADYADVLNRGMAGIMADAAARLKAERGPDASVEKQGNLAAMMTCCMSAARLAARYGEECRRLAGAERNSRRRSELQELAEICANVPMWPARTLHEAIQSLWFTHLAIYLECDNVAFSFGRMDEYLLPFYEADLGAGRISENGALELIEALWIKIYENVRGEIGHVQTVTSGGVKADGEDGTNALTWLMACATRELGNVGPSLAIRCCPKTPDRLLRYALETMRLGRYMPQLYNDEAMVPAIASCCVPVEDAREYGLIGCHEPTICGKGYTRPASWPGYFCFQDCLELALGNGHKLDTGEVAGPETGDPAGWREFDDLWAAFVAQMAAMVARKVGEANAGEVIKREFIPRPMLSALIDGCVERGTDFTAGGARYNFSGFEAYGIGTCADSLYALRQLCFDESAVSVPEFVEVLRDNWAGREELRQRVRREFPHWGNDADAVDELAVRMVARLQGELDGHTNARGGPFTLGLWSFWEHVFHGQDVAASADGRRHGEMLSHSMDPMIGCGFAGPTGAIRSAAKLDMSRMANGGSLLLEFQSNLFDTDAGPDAVLALVRTYFGLGGIQLQLSTVSPERLEAAVREPEQHQDLVVRVAGYSDYFVRQDPQRQAYIIAREKFDLR